MGLPDPEVERLLREARPEPRREFVWDLETKLMARAVPRWRPLLVAASALSSLLVVLTVVLGLTGALPHGLMGDRAVEAGSDCRTVTVQRVERRPRLIVAPNGEFEIRYRRVVVDEVSTICGGSSSERSRRSPRDAAP